MTPTVQTDQSGTLAGPVLQPTHLPSMVRGPGHVRLFGASASFLENGENVFFQARLELRESPTAAGLWVLLAPPPVVTIQPLPKAT